jgi:ElaB/YqjD/DUF883 family membrane-anchored ribosome-binding protein
MEDFNKDSRYSGDKILPESILELIQVLKLVANFPKSLPEEKLITELLNQSRFCSLNDRLKKVANLFDNLNVIVRFTEENEQLYDYRYSQICRDYKNRLNELKLEYRDNKKLKDTCQTLLRILGDNIEILCRKASDEQSSEIDENIYPIKVTQQDLLVQILKRIEQMSEASKRNIIFNSPGQYIEQNPGIAQQNNNASEFRNDPAFKETRDEIVEVFSRLQQNHPTATEEEAQDIIEAEFTEIRTKQPTKWQTFRQQLLNRERWFNGGKAALSETAKHYVDNNVFYKVGLAFLDGFSADEE